MWQNRKTKIEALQQRVSNELATEVTYRFNKLAKKDFEAWFKFHNAIYNNLQNEKYINQLRKNAGIATTRFYSFQNMQIIQNAIFTNANDDFMQFDLNN
jgi:hypothetical protein